MRIVVVASLAWSLVNFRGRLLADLVAAGHEVTACAPDEDPAVSARLAAMGVGYRTISMARTGLNPWTDLGTLAGLVQLFRRLRPQLVLAYTQKPIIYAGLASRLVRPRPRFFAMVTGLGHAFEPGGNRLLRQIVARLYRPALADAEAVFVFNGDDRDEMLRHRMIAPKKPVIQVPGSGVDLHHYAAAPPVAAPHFLMIARLLRSKGVVEFVEAARRLRARYPDARFTLLGPQEPPPAGIDDAQLARWIAEGAVEFAGETRDVRPALAAASVFVLPSWYREGLPRTILEAMATGRPVITTDMPGCREPIDDGSNGFLVPTRDAGALAAAMERFITDPQLGRRMGARARADVAQRFSVERVNAILLAAMRLHAPAQAEPAAAPVFPPAREAVA